MNEEEINDEKTPVEYLFEMLWKTPIDKLTWNAIKEEALKKEKKLVEKTWWAGFDEAESGEIIYPSEDGNGYYENVIRKKKNERKEI